MQDSKTRIFSTCINTEAWQSLYSLWYDRRKRLRWWILPVTQPVFELTFWYATRSCNILFCIWPFSSTDTWISNTRGAFFNSNSGGMFSVCLCGKYGRMPDSRQRWRDGSYGTRVRVTVGPWNRAATRFLQHMMSLHLQQQRGWGAVIADLGMTAPLAATWYSSLLTVRKKKKAPTPPVEWRHIRRNLLQVRVPVPYWHIGRARFLFLTRWRARS
jgi:hypothetical protein